MLIQSQARFSFIQEKMNRPDSDFRQYETHLLTSSGRGRAMLLEGPGTSGWFIAVGGSVQQGNIVVRVVRPWTAAELGMVDEMQWSFLAQRLKGAGLHTVVLIDLMILSQASQCSGIFLELWWLEEKIPHFVWWNRSFQHSRLSKMLIPVYPKVACEES